MKTTPGPKWFNDKLRREISKHLSCKRIPSRNRWGIFHDGWGYHESCVMVCEDQGRDVDLASGWVERKLREMNRMKYLGNSDALSEQICALEKRMIAKGVPAAARDEMERDHAALMARLDGVFRDFTAEVQKLVDEEERDKERIRGDAFREMAKDIKAVVKQRTLIHVPGPVIGLLD